MTDQLGYIDSDKQLFLAIIKGDREAFEHLFEKYYTVLCDYSCTYLEEKSAAEDVVQDIFVYVWHNRKVIQIQGSVKGYLFTAVKHQTINVLKRRTIERNHSRLLSEFWEDLSKSGYSEEEEKRLEHLQDVLHSLSPQCHAVFIKSCQEGKKYREIAEELQISINTVKSHILKAYREIRRKIAIPNTENIDND